MDNNKIFSTISWRNRLAREVEAQIMLSKEQYRLNYGRIPEDNKSAPDGPKNRPERHNSEEHPKR